MRKGLRILLWMAAAVVMLLAVVYFTMSSKLNQMESQGFADVNIASLPDGVHKGRAEAVLVAAEVEVEVAGGRLQAIRLLEYRHGQGWGAEGIIDHMVAQNAVDVDVVSGATASSTVIKSAVRNALKEAAR